jgi:hypothetical protein
MTLVNEGLGSAEWMEHGAIRVLVVNPFDLVERL